ncbi:MAG TPA: hypothetical protein VMP67_03555 [Candidatus Limnocylindria bacterium]|nr:hypothetical protein [Candidatus Limnocylindria bacterium]
MPRSLPPLALHPLLFAAYAVLFLYAENIQLVSTSEVLAPLFWSVAAAGVLLVVASLLLRDVRRGALLASGLLIVFFGYGHLAGVSVPEIAGWPLLTAWAAFVLGICGLLLLRSGWLARLTTGLNVAGLVLVIFTLATIVPYIAGRPARANDDEVPPSGLSAQRTTARDIYYLVFDRYGSESSLAAEYGISDNDLYGWLAERGFEVAPAAHANYSRTALSLASVLNLDYLDDVAAQEGAASADYGPVHGMFQEHIVGRFLREQGYRYVHIGSWFNPTRRVAIADESLESESTTEFGAVLDGTTALPLLASLLGEDEPMSPDDETHVEHGRFQFRALQRVIGDPGPKFVLAHVLLPHDPYTFDEDGEYVPEAERRGVPVAEQYRAQLEYTNGQIKALVEALLARPAAQRPIIIVQADEGPYPARYDADVLGFDWRTATGAELEMKFGILNAFYLPDEAGLPTGASDLYPSMSSVNTFRLVLGRYFGLDLPLLPDRSWVSASPRRPYDLSEVTHRLEVSEP